MPCCNALGGELGGASSQGGVFPAHGASQGILLL